MKINKDLIRNIKGFLDEDEGRCLYEIALKDFEKNPPVTNIILSSLGYCHEAIKDYDSAIKYFERIASGSENLLKAEALFNLGRLYAGRGDTARSMESYRKVMTNYTDSMYIELINAALRKGYKWGEMSWILESNDMINRAIQVIGGKVYKTYRLYLKAL